jgi:hypothetical protein
MNVETEAAVIASNRNQPPVKWVQVEPLTGRKDMGRLTAAAAIVEENE